MGTKQLIIVWIAFLLVTACTREVIISPSGETEGKVPVSLRLLIDTTTGTTRASSWEYDEFFPGIREEERKVSDILLVVFKNTILEEFIYFGPGDFEQDASDYSITLEDEDGEDLLELEPGPHYFYAILNIPDDLHTTLVATLDGQQGNMTKETFEQIIVEKSLDEMTGNGSHFLMTNFTPPTLRGIYSEEQLENNSELTNTIQLSVGRAVGKISFAYVASEVQTGELHGRLQDIRYKLLNNPSRMYLMPVMEDQILYTPHYYTTVHDPGYFTPSATDPDILLETSSPWLTATTITTKETQSPEEFDYGYCIENNNQSPPRSTSTLLLIEAKFIPAVWLNSDGTEGGPSADGTFYRIGCYNTAGVLYAYEQGYYNNRPSDEILDQYNANSNAVSVYDVETYQQGITYYGFWLKQNDQYMIKRNSYYKIAITHIHGAGVPEPGDVIDPDVDPEDPSTYGRLAVFAVTWIEENMEISIGEDPYEGEKTDLDSSVKEWQDKEQENELNSGSEWE